jgi:hypothetical protein
MFGSSVAFDSLYGRLPMTTRGRYSDLTNTNGNTFTEIVVNTKCGFVSIRAEVAIYSLKTQYSRNTVESPVYCKYYHGDRR